MSRPFKKFERLLGLLSLALVLVPSLSWAAFQVPPLKAPVVDEANLIPPDQQRKMNEALQHLHRQGGTQIAVLTLPSLEGTTIEQASIEVAEKWQLGSDQKDKGLIIFVAVEERKIRIEVGQGLEGTVPDAYAKRIIDETMIPLFRSGHPESGILLGLMQVASLTNPDVNLKSFFEGQDFRSQRQGQQKNSLVSRIFFFLMMIVMFILFIFNPRLFLLMMLGSAIGGRRRGLGGGFGGGGFGGYSGGGGGFSGGGASGGW